jgi:peptide/nickel transport system substrate-binding protein
LYLVSSLFSRFKRGTRSKQASLPHAHEDLALVRKVQGRRYPRFAQLKHIHKILSTKERGLFRAAQIGSVIGLVWLFIGMYLGGQSIVAAAGGRYTEAVIGTPSAMNPVYAPLNDVDADLARLVFSGLLTYSSTQELKPDLAKEYTVSADGKTYTFTLRDDVTWHDGKPFSSRDVLFTFEMIQNPLSGSPLLVSFQGVEVSAPNDTTVTFTLPEPFAPFLSTLTVGMLPEHLLFDVSADRLRLHRFNTQPVGTGPFQFHALTKADTGFISRVTLKRFDHYYSGPSFLDEVVLEFFDGDGAYDRAIQALREQKVDGVSFVPVAFRDRVERKYLSVHTLELPQYTALFFNGKRTGVLQNAVVRQALAEALEKERIVKDGLKGEGEVIQSPVLRGFPGFDETKGVVTYDPSAANKKLDEIYPPISREEFMTARVDALMLAYDAANPTTSTTPQISSSTIDISTTTLRDQAKVDSIAKITSEMQPAQTFYRRAAKAKDLLTIRLVTADTEEYRKVAETTAGFWQEIGVQTVITTVPPKDMARTVLRDRDYDVLLYSVIVGSDPDQYPFWHSSQATHPGLNLAGYSNRKVDELLVAMRTATSTESRITAAGAFQDQLLTDRPAIFLYTPTYTYVTNNLVRGVNVERIFEPSDRFAAITSWYVKTKREW